MCNRCTGCVAMATLWKCVAEPSGNPPGPPHAARMPHTHTTLAGKDSPHRRSAPAACSVPYRPYCGCCNANAKCYALCLVAVSCLLHTVSLSSRTATIKLCLCSFFFFTARRSARIASAVLAIAIPSVCPSVCYTPVLCQNDGT